MAPVPPSAPDPSGSRPAPARPGSYDVLGGLPPDPAPGVRGGARRAGPPPAHRRPGDAPLGWLLLVPVAVCWLGGLVAPLLKTLWLSVHGGSLLIPGGTAGFTGLQNYADLARTPTLGNAVGFTVAVVAVRVVAVGVVPVLLAWATAYAGRRAAVPLSVVFSVPLVVATPLLAAAGAVTSGAGRAGLSTPAGARFAVLGLNASHALLYGCALGLVVLVAALRADPTRPSSGLLGRGFVTVWAFGIAAAAAYGLQALTEVSVLTGGGPGGATTTLGSLLIQISLLQARIGPGAALGVLLLLPVLGLGLLAGWLVLAGRISFDLSVRPHRWPTGRPPVAPMVAGGLALVVALVAWVRAILPVASGWSGGADTRQLGGVVAYGLTHDLPTTLVVVVVAACGAAGLVLLRPLGPYSEWLLLPLAPWLFVTNVPLADNLFAAFTRGGPQWPFVHLQPALSFLPLLTFAFVLLLRGAEPRWRAAQARQEPAAFGRHVLFRLAPGAAGLTVGALVASAHEFVTPYVTVVGGDRFPLARVVTLQVTSFATDGGVTAYDLPFAIPGAIVLGLLVAWYAGRLVVRADVPPPRPPMPPAMPPPMSPPGAGPAT